SGRRRAGRSHAPGGRDVPRDGRRPTRGPDEPDGLQERVPSRAHDDPADAEQPAQILDQRRRGDAGPPAPARPRVSAAAGSGPRGRGRHQGPPGSGGSRPPEGADGVVAGIQAGEPQAASRAAFAAGQPPAGFEQGALLGTVRDVLQGSGGGGGAGVPWPVRPRIPPCLRGATQEAVMETCLKSARPTEGSAAMRGALRAPALGFLSLLGVALTSCGGAPPPPTVAVVTITASADANPDAAGQGAPVAVRIYQLASTANFDKADFFQLYQHEQETLGTDLLGRD